MNRNPQSKRKVLLAFTISKTALFRGVVRYAREHDWHLVTDMVYTGQVPEGWRGDGILTILNHRPELVNFIRRAELPVVAITLINEQVKVPRIEGDNVGIGRLAAEHFLERGYRHFAWVPFMNDVMNAERFEGFSARLRKAKFDCHTLPAMHVGRRGTGRENWVARRERLRAELARLPHPTGVFTYNDCVAADVIDACRDEGLLVPEQIAVLGVDNDPDVCDCAPIPLSSVRHDLEGMAYAGAEMLDRMMDGRPAPKTIRRVPPQGIVTRVSTDIHAVGNLEVAKALRCIAEQFANPLLSVDDVAAAAGLSRRQLERRFREEMPCTINEHIVRARVAHAKTRLEETEEKVGEIAKQAGFASGGHLFRTFRQRVGATPLGYRRNGAEKLDEPAK